MVGTLKPERNRTMTYEEAVKAIAARDAAKEKATGLTASQRAVAAIQAKRAKRAAKRRPITRVRDAER